MLRKPASSTWMLHGNTAQSLRKFLVRSRLNLKLFELSNLFTLIWVTCLLWSLQVLKLGLRMRGFFSWCLRAWKFSKRSIRPVVSEIAIFGVERQWSILIIEFFKTFFTFWTRFGLIRLNKDASWSWVFLLLLQKLLLWVQFLYVVEHLGIFERCLTTKWVSLLLV